MTPEKPGEHTDNSAAGGPLTRFFAAVHCNGYVAGHTHNFYRYPARFSPQFARAAIETFSNPGDTILDPFMGGGTSAVEALAAGRRFVGCDLNPLAAFITRVKTTPLSQGDAEQVVEWASLLQGHINLHADNAPHNSWEFYQRNLPWRKRKALEMALDTLCLLSNARRRRFARCSLLKTGQWALDCRLEVPSLEEFLTTHRRDVAQMATAARAFGRAVSDAFGTPDSLHKQRLRLLSRTAQGLDHDGRLPRDWLPPRLVLTSPPYVGVHVLYHRWQIQGRKETPAPYWLADCQDGHGTAHYTFGDRRRKGVETYMGHLREAFRSVAALLDAKSRVVQLVAFSKPDAQLAPYLEAMQAAGLEETDVCGFAGSFERVWRIVPNRKWYARVKGDLPKRQEVLLIHRKRRSGPSV
jgi:DNA methylase